MVESYITRAKNMEIKNIRKAVIPAAGLGKRMRPISNIIPKELLPVGTKPLIQYAVEDLLHSGIKHIFIVISKRKSSIKKYFEEVFRPTVSKIYFGYQKYPTGVPDAIYTARNFVGKEDFLLVMPDVIVERGFSKKFLSKVQRLRLDLCKYIGIGAYIKVSTSKLKKSEATLVLVRVKKANEFGVVKLDKNGRILSMIEKPSASKARAYKVNNKYLAMTGLLVLKPDIFQYIKRTPIGKYGERWLTDAIEKMRQEGADVYGYVFSGKWVDIGSKAFLDHLIFDLKHSPDIPSP